MDLLFRSTRLRLAFWYTAVTAILLLLLATGVYLYVRHTLIDRIDDTLKHVVEVVERSIVIQPIAASKTAYKVNLAASFRYNVDVVGDDRIDLEWFNPQGRLLWSTFSSPLNVPLNLNHKKETVSLSRKKTFRQVTDPIKFHSQMLGYLRVSHPWFEVTKPIHQFTRDLIIGISLMILAVGTIGWWLSGIAIEPVRQSYFSLKQFTADASHELRNPIATIQTNVQMALAYPETELELQQQQLRVIERITKRLGRLVNDLLFLARSDSGMVEMNFQPVQLDALLIEVIEEQRTIAERKGIVLSLDIIELESNRKTTASIDSAHEALFTILGDWDSLARLFTNLLANAIKYTADENSSRDRKLPLAIAIELKQIKKNISSRKVREYNRQNYFQVTIKDTGKGIAESDLPYIFDRFYRADPARSRQVDLAFGTGAGLGLAIAKAIVDNHQGNITVETIINEGTKFQIILPQNS
ncbi:signal transduction histidine kinase [Xenococcus sp. PCC 7305]|uniref:sensor histidine kinase n=1 Tax=Xenococcus sp. PCC 7305 TaxID=102125 RepID=UPI0002AC10B8|nr:HAMP domain-containing sensor histidine kinase [Xenococcus sp. PCC 7305]ELS02088.1 signal transduction histidine kinase [Xenococcus sp. PCC 7305]